MEQNSETNKAKSQVLITIGVVLGIMLLLTLGILGSIIGIKNKGIRYEESISENLANINKEKTRKYSVFTNMVDAIKSYNKYEGETLTKIIEARSNGDVEAGEQLLNVLVEQYPELKSNENYQQYLTEISVTENRIANYIEVYNKELKDYRAWGRSFPASMFYTVDNSFELWNDDKTNIDIDGNLFAE